MWGEIIRGNWNSYEKKIDAGCFHKRTAGCVLPGKESTVL